VFSHVWSVLSQCNTRLRLLHLFYDVEVMYLLYSDKTWIFADQLERAKGPIYIMKSDKPRGMLVEHEPRASDVRIHRVPLNLLSSFDHMRGPLYLRECFPFRS